MIKPFIIKCCIKCNELYLYVRNTSHTVLSEEEVKNLFQIAIESQTDKNERANKIGFSLAYCLPCQQALMKEEDYATVKTEVAVELKKQG